MASPVHRRVPSAAWFGGPEGSGPAAGSPGPVAGGNSGPTGVPATRLSQQRIQARTQGCGGGLPVSLHQHIRGTTGSSGGSGGGLAPPGSTSASLVTSRHAPLPASAASSPPSHSASFLDHPEAVAAHMARQLHSTTSTNGSSNTANNSSRASGVPIVPGSQRRNSQGHLEASTSQRGVRRNSGSLGSPPSIRGYLDACAASPSGARAGLPVAEQLGELQAEMRAEVGAELRAEPRAAEVRAEPRAELRGELRGSTTAAGIRPSTGSGGRASTNSGGYGSAHLHEDTSEHFFGNGSTSQARNRRSTQSTAGLGTVEYPSTPPPRAHAQGFADLRAEALRAAAAALPQGRGGAVSERPERLLHAERLLAEAFQAGVADTHDWVERRMESLQVQAEDFDAGEESPPEEEYAAAASRSALWATPAWHQGPSAHSSRAVAHTASGHAVAAGGAGRDRPHRNRAGIAARDAQTRNMGASRDTVRGGGGNRNPMLPRPTAVSHRLHDEAQSARPQARPPTLHNTHRAPAARAPGALEQREKDSRLGSLLQLAAMRGFGDLDPEPATGLLEDAGWDVMEAFDGLCRRSGAVPEVAEAAATVSSSTSGPNGRRHSARAAHQRGGSSPTHGAALARPNSADLNSLASLSQFAAVAGSGRHAGRQQTSELEELEHLRFMQEEWVQEEWDEMLEADEASLQHRHSMARSLAAARVSEEFMDESYGTDVFSDSDDAGPPIHRHFLRGRPGRAMSLDTATTSALSMDALRHASLDEVFVPYAFSEDDEEAHGLHALVNALIRTQDEADLQDAMRRSTEEAYSGGFSVPPVDEAVLRQTTKTSEFRDGDAAGQCSICLMEFEEGEAVRKLECTHRFHMHCVDQWLFQSGQCPVCKHRVGSN